MNKGQRLYKFILGLLMPFLFLACSSKERIKIDGGTFNVDGKDVQLICGEMHYARIPHEYWRDRLKRARAMGLNTISVYVFWNFHERQPGEFDFSGQADVAEFVRKGHGLPQQRSPLPGVLRTLYKSAWQTTGPVDGQ